MSLPIAALDKCLLDEGSLDALFLPHLIKVPIALAVEAFVKYCPLPVENITEGLGMENTDLMGLRRHVSNEISRFRSKDSDLKTDSLEFTVSCALQHYVGKVE
eukprot:SAG11_NODE_20540_length_443_cov_1.037791_1_plen_103_part_00